MRHRLAKKAEFCYSPTISEISVSKTAVYSTGMQPGTSTWAFSKSVDLAPPYTNNRAVMFNGDTVDATWTLSANKWGTDVNYQGVVTGTISINNPTPAVITVNSIIDQITGGPAATVSCPVGTPFTVPSCSFATCSYTSYYPTAPPPGTYTTAAQVQFQVSGNSGAEGKGRVQERPTSPVAAARDESLANACAGPPKCWDHGPLPLYTLPALAPAFCSSALSLPLRTPPPLPLCS